MKGFVYGLILLTAFTAFATDAQAHEKRAVGEMQWVVGFLTEPAFSGQPNGIDLSVQDAEGQPVDGLEESLKAEVLTPDRTQSAALSFEKRYGKPGKYAAYFTPSKSGDYIFQITGQAGGAAVNETFSSGPGTFGAVRELLLFPAGSAE